MHARHRTALLLAALTCASACRAHRAAPLEAAPAAALRSVERRPFAYPDASRGDVIDEYHGTRVADPYRWLEDTDSARTRNWIDAQVRLFDSYMDGVPERARIESRLASLWDYEKVETPSRHGARLFYRRNDGLQNQAPLYVIDRAGAKPRLLLDPNKLSDDGTVALSGIAISEDGEWLAYGLADAGSDWNRWRIRNVNSGTDLPETLDWIKFSGASWMRDGSGFFYSRYDAPVRGAELSAVNKSQKVYFHVPGTEQSQDALVYARTDQPEWGFGAQVSEDGQYLVLQVSQGTDPRNRTFYAQLPKADALRSGAPLSVVELVGQLEASFDFVGNDGPLFWYLTNLGAARGKLIEIDTRTPKRSEWRTLVPESQHTLRSVSYVGGKFIASYLEDAHTAVRVFEKNGAPAGEVALPGLGSAGGFGGRGDRSETYYSYTSFNTPPEVWRYDVSSGKAELWSRPKVSFDPARYTTEQVFYRSKDGTRVPMFLSYKKGAQRNGLNATLLYGYGGFDVSLTPSFSVTNLLWMEMGGVYALANLRGGGEYGETWHQAGTLGKKQNVFDDFIAAAEFLVAERWTRPDRLAIQGGSNGGLLVGACITQRPELFGAALPAVGVMDMLRFHKFTIGWAWTSDYGSSDDPEQFKALLAYSPYHNVREGACYPPTLVSTADHDDRVVPGHSFKFAAALQHAQSCINPTLIRIEVRAGHGAGKPTKKRIAEAADQLAFLVHELGVVWP